MSDLDKTQFLSSAMLPRLPGLTLDGLLGEGGMGRVYWGTQEPLGRPVAVKILAERLQQDDLARESFLAEARAMAVVDHPNVVRCLHAGFTEEGTPFLVMELVAGPTLATLVEESGALAEAAALELLEGLLSGLEAAHAQGVLHLDVKPENVLLAPDPAARGAMPYIPKLADFGIGRLQARATQEATAGSPRYMAPEQHASLARCDARSDLYAMGCVFAFMLLGRAPFGGESAAELMAAKRGFHAAAAVPSASPAAAALLDALMALSPAQRPASAAEALARVRALRAASARTAGTSRRRLLPWVAAALVAIGGAASLAVWRPGAHGVSAEPTYTLAAPPPTPAPTPVPAIDPAPTERRALLRESYANRAAEWQRVSGQWGPEDDGPGVIGIPGGEAAVLRRVLPAEPWVLAATIGTSGEGDFRGREAILAVTMPDGSGIELRLQDLGATALLRVGGGATLPLAERSARIEIVASGGRIVARESGREVASAPLVPGAVVELRAPDGPALFRDLAIAPE